MEKQFNISAVSNIEKDVSEILKQMDTSRRLISVTLSGNNLIMKFSDEASKSARSFVKQFSKKDKTLKKRGVRKGYKSVDEIMERAFNKEQVKDIRNNGFELVGVIETNKFWILFWSKA